MPAEAWLDGAAGVSLHEADYTQRCRRQGSIACPCTLFNFCVFPCNRYDNVHVQEGQPGFPLPAEAWLDELLASIFRMLINLESTDAKGKDHITFLMNDSSLYRQAHLLCVAVSWNHKPLKEVSSSLGILRAPGASHVGKYQNLIPPIALGLWHAQVPEIRSVSIVFLHVPRCEQQQIDALHNLTVHTGW